MQYRNTYIRFIEDKKYQKRVAKDAIQK